MAVTAQRSTETQARGESWRGTWITCIVLLLMGATTAAQISYGFRAWTSEEIRRRRVLDDPLPLSPLALRSARDERIELWNGRRVENAEAPPLYLMHFMYTRCPSYCRVLGSEFERIQRQLGNDPVDARIRLLSISFDPAVDDAAALGDYEKRYRVSHARWSVVAPAEVGSIQTMLDEAGVVVIPDGMGGYAHNAAIQVVSPAGRIVRIFDVDAYEDALAYARAAAP